MIGEYDLNPIIALFAFLRALCARRVSLAAENLALKQQLVVLRRSVKRPTLRRGDRIFWVWLCSICQHWRSWLVIVQPETVIHWHRQGFKLYWHWKARKGRMGRPAIAAQLKTLIRRMARENPLWGAPRIQSELKLLGYDLGESTVAKYMQRRGSKPPSQSWRTFLDNHVRDLVHRFFHNSHRKLSYPVLLHRPRASTTLCGPFQCHGASHWPVDSPTTD